MCTLIFPPDLVTRGAEMSSSMYYKMSEVENHEKTFNTKITRFTKLSCLTKLMQGIKLMKLI